MQQELERQRTEQAEQEETVDKATANETNSSSSTSKHPKRPLATRGDSILEDPTNVMAPPKTTIFESAGDVLNPPLPPHSWITDPSSRARTIFHDRVYHPEDIPPPPLKKLSRLKSFSSDTYTQGSQSGQQQNTSSWQSGGSGPIDSSGMRVEEKIARAYHKDLSWRKVLVRLEPDAHNNMIVRRMFANAYGWPVVKHLCDTHFGDTYTANTRDEREPAFDRARETENAVGEQGEEVRGQSDVEVPRRRGSELREAADELAPLRKSSKGEGDKGSPEIRLSRAESDQWDDMYFEGTEDDDDYDDDSPLSTYNPFQRFLSPAQSSKQKVKQSQPQRIATGGGSGSTTMSTRDHATTNANVTTSTAPKTPSKLKTQRDPNSPEIADRLTDSPPPASPTVEMEGHRGLGLSPALKKESPSSSKRHVSGGSSTSEVGLRKGLDGVVGSPPGSRGEGTSAATASAGGGGEGAQRQGSQGVVEQVARLSATKEEDGAREG
ncbi:hypothetical protein LTS18_010682 [Coniosporium uncinatum]|uniref:Uncharacterized protein n=1 Tax=Coniosporium uncinatum TaxID=93489 RepID=A0ACC3DKS2_9PEZI|nr:hypothetical protein LTS18_010682 [Coniosporium uncinatum]